MHKKALVLSLATALLAGCGADTDTVEIDTPLAMQSEDSATNLTAEPKHPATVKALNRYMASALRQADFLYRLQDYIDAQSGGPSEGFLRIVTSPKEARRVINQGKLKAIWPNDRPLAASFTTDINGMAAQPWPSATKIEYPFTLFNGKEWGNKFAGIEPITFEMSSSPMGARQFNYNDEGIAHYGLYADWVEALRIHGGEEALNALYSSAEDYIRAWEKVENR